MAKMDGSRNNTTPSSIHTVRVNNGDGDGDLIDLQGISVSRLSSDQVLAIKMILESVIELTDDCVVVFDKDCNYLFVNQAAIEHIGANPEQVYGKNIRDGMCHLPEEMMYLWINRIEDVFRTGTSKSYFDKSLINGNHVYSKVLMRPVRYPDGEIFAVTVYSLDTTEHRTLLNDKKKTEQFLMDFYVSGYIPLFKLRYRDGKMIDYNRAFSVLIGYENTNPPANSLDEMFFIDNNKTKEILNALKKKGHINDFLVKFGRRDGQIGWGKIFAKLDGSSDTIDAVIIDVTADEILTVTEKQVLKHILHGLGNKQIAKTMHRSVRTIEDHRSNIMHKLGAGNIVELIKISQSMDV